ncbi:MAG: ATP synthase F0 subunit B [Candidatus Schekmanbacteria bacterium]|nr:ATP synthase F0 subunit B [Candidatus Schekmanbacteria bacterium]
MAHPLDRTDHPWRSRVAVSLAHVATAAAWLVPTLAAATEEGHEGGGDSTLLLIRALNFVACFALLFVLLRRPLGGFLRQRTKDIADKLNQAKLHREEVAAMLVAERRRCEDITREIQQLSESGRIEAQKEYENVVAAARKEADRIVAMVDSRIAAETAQAKLTLRAYAAELAVELAERNLVDEMGPEIDAKLRRAFMKSEAAKDRPTG